MAESVAGAYEVRHPSSLHSEASMSPRQRAALWALRTVLVPSRYNVSVHLDDGRVAVYNTFTAALSLLPHKAWQKLLASDCRTAFDPSAVPAAVKRLQQGGYLIAEGTDEIELVRQHYQRARHDRVAGFTANVLVTMGCNLACQYCFQGRTQIEMKPRMMAQETEEAVVAYLQRSAADKQSLMVSWFGGEPLLGLRQIKRMTPPLTTFCDARGIAYHAVITTNGVLLDREAVDALVAARVSQVQVSLDVPTEHKNDKQGRDTQQAVLDNLVYAAERIPVQIRINLSKDDEQEWERLFADMVRRGLQKTLASIFIAHVYEPEMARRAGVGSPESHATYVHVMKRQYDRGKALGLPLSHAVASSCGSGCAATSSTAVTIDPEGLIYKCPDDAGRPDRAFSSVFTEGVLKPENLLRWLTYDWFQHDACQQCTMMPQCAGGCPHQRLFQPGRPNDTYCYWQLRGDLEGKVRNTVQALMSARGPH